MSFPLCRPPSIADAFDGQPPPCRPWGAQFGNAEVALSGGVLAITPRSDGANTGGCLASAPIRFEGDGIFVEVPAALTGHGFSSLSGQGSANAPSMGYRDGMLELTIPARPITALPYDPVAMRWWRLRPDAAAGVTIAEYGADGLHWKRLGAIDLEPESQITVQLVAGVTAIDLQPATTRFAHLDICPPRP